VRITYDPAADAAYVYLTGEPLSRGRTSILADPPEGVQAFFVLDWKDDRLVGIEILDASSRLHPRPPPGSRNPQLIPTPLDRGADRRASDRSAPRLAVSHHAQRVRVREELELACL